jgi:hypothetical protein
MFTPKLCTADHTLSACQLTAAHVSAIRCQGRPKRRPVGRSKREPVEGKKQGVSGEEGRWSVAEAALLPQGAFGGGVSGSAAGFFCGGFA